MVEREKKESVIDWGKKKVCWIGLRTFISIRCHTIPFISVYLRSRVILRYEGRPYALAPLSLSIVVTPLFTPNRYYVLCLTRPTLRSVFAY